MSDCCHRFAEAIKDGIVIEKEENIPYIQMPPHVSQTKNGVTVKTLWVVILYCPWCGTKLPYYF